METLLRKDRIEDVNPYLFQKIQTKINEEKKKLIPSWSVNTLRYSIIGLVLIMGLNVYSILNSNQNADSNIISQNDSYNQFIEDNHFDALSSLYPAELLSNE